MIPNPLRQCVLLSMLLAVAAVRAGPAEIADLEQQIAAGEAQIEASQGLLRRALSGYEGDPGEAGARLRALKLQQAQTQAELKRALAAERERATMDQSMPSETSAYEARRRAQKQQKPPSVESVPAGTLLPAPTL
jgi:hypothetical protein